MGVGVGDRDGELEATSSTQLAERLQEVGRVTNQTFFFFLAIRLCYSIEEEKASQMLVAKSEHMLFLCPCCF